MTSRSTKSTTRKSTSTSRTRRTAPPACSLAGKNGASRALYNAFHTAVHAARFVCLPNEPADGHPWRLRRSPTTLKAWARHSASPRTRPTFRPTSIKAAAPSATSGGTPIKVSQGFTVGGTSTAAASKYNAWDPNIKPELIQQYNLTLQTLMTIITSPSRLDTSETSHSISSFPNRSTRKRFRGQHGDSAVQRGSSASAARST